MPEPTLEDLTSLYDHARQLQSRHPGEPLPNHGEPYPDHDLHRRYRPTDDRRRRGMDAAAVLEAHFGRAGAHPRELTWAFHEVAVDIHHNAHVAAAALRADRGRVRETGRWLVRHSPDRCSALIGLALLAEDHPDDDMELIQTIGLLSDRFTPLAAHALKRRSGGGDGLIWLAERVTGWGRVYVVEALCEVGGLRVRPWLLRSACDGNFLNGYFAGEVAAAAHLHEAVTAEAVDDQVTDHTGRLVAIMAQSSGMGVTWEQYPPIRHVLDAHSRLLARQSPARERYRYAAAIAAHLKKVDDCDLPAGLREELLGRYLAVLRAPEWVETVRAGIDSFMNDVAERLGLPLGPGVSGPS